MFKHPVFFVALGLLASAVTATNLCVDCHLEIAPNIITDWQLSKHAENGVTCDACHGGHL